MTKRNEDKEPINRSMTRRQFMVSGLVLVMTAVLASCGLPIGGRKTASSPETSPSQTPSPSSQPSAAASPAATLAPTPVCGKDDTPAVTEGPYFKPNSPERASLLETGMKGTKLTIAGIVLSTACKPIPHALIDFWQANADGEYDNKGFTLRGHQYTDEKGQFRLETIVPGLYPGRTRHIHVKAQAPNRDILTTQLFFPNEAGNAKDGIFKKELLMDVKSNADGSQNATFNFVLHA